MISFDPSDAPTTAPAWPNSSLGVGGSYKRVDKPPLVVTSSSTTSPTLAQSEVHVNTTLGEVAVANVGGADIVGVI